VRARFSADALADLEDIADHIAQDSPRRALSFVRELRAACLDLGDMPLRFPVIGERDGTPVRRRVHQNYLIFYRVPDDRTLGILRILHGARDFERLLFPDD
jgi:plasmid stabilization system protein ParE